MKNYQRPDALTNIADAERIFADLLQGLADMQPGFPLAQLKTFVDQEFAQIKHVLHGISLLGQCPDGVNASLICRGEKLSIAIMAALLEARGHKVSVINPVENCWLSATTLNPLSILLNPLAVSPPAKSRQTTWC